MKKTRKIFAVLLSLLLVFTVIPFMQGAVYADTEEDIAADLAETDESPMPDVEEDVTADSAKSDESPMPITADLMEPDSSPVPNSWMERIMGQNRYATSIELAKRCLEETGESCFPSAIIVTGDDFPDALASAPLAAALNAPIILISASQERTMNNALEFLKTYVQPGGKVFLIGGRSVMPARFFNSVRDLGFKAPRIYGADRVATNVKILQYLKQIGYQFRNILICSSASWADAATAAATGQPIMLVNSKGYITMDQLVFLGSFQRRPILKIIGGTGAVSDKVDRILVEDLPYAQPERIAGANRAETAVKVAETFFSEESAEKVVIAYGANYPDCIAGGLFAHIVNAPILYGDSAHPDSYMAANAPYVEKCGVQFAYVLGGPSLVSDAFVRDMLEK